MAFLLCVSFSGYGAMRKVSSSVGCPLSGRYMLLIHTTFGDTSMPCDTPNDINLCVERVKSGTR